MHIQLERRSVAELQPHENNAKRHAPEDVAAIAASIQRFGFNDPIGITPDGSIVEGEGRWRAAQSLGLEEVPVIVLSEMTEEEADLYRIAHNKIAMTTGFNIEVLVSNLRILVDNDISLSVMGFDEASASSLFGQSGATQSRIAQQLGKVSTAQSDNVFEFLVMWDDAKAKDEFEAFLQTIREPGENAADALVRHLDKTVYGAETTIAGEEHVHVH